MVDDLVMGLIVGSLAAVVLMGLPAFALARRLKVGHREEVRRYDASIVDLRRERAEDKETNRRLRHELVSQSPERLLEVANAAEVERETATSERDQALEQLQLVEQDLSLANGRLADREARLRQYREALKEIRVALEAQDRVRSMRAADGLIDTDTGDLPVGALGGVNMGSAGIGSTGLGSSGLGSTGLDGARIEQSGLGPSSFDGDRLEPSSAESQEIETADATAFD